jgi:predicted RecA/RadA family phage recombinase
MKNYIQAGETLDVTAPYAVLSGDGVKIGALFGIALADAAIGTAVRICTVGVVRGKKLSAQAWAVGDKVYWDDAAKNLTTVVGANILVGAAVAAAVNPSVVGNVRLDGTTR